MKAAFLREQGPPDVLQSGDLPDPVPGPGEVLVRVGASAVNPVDTYIRAGMIPLARAVPFIPGCDLAGTVVAVGEEVTRFHVGDRVWGSNQGVQGRQGTLAELAVVKEDWLYPTPDAISDEEAAAGALTGITAQLGLFVHGGLKSGEWLFVNGGSGGVGSAVIQFAKQAGARVLTTAGSEENCRYCSEIGADVVLSYRSPTLDADLKRELEPHGGVDMWWETQREPDLQRVISFMRKRGRIIVMAGRQAQPQFTLGSFYTNDLQILGFMIFNAGADEQRECAERMNALWSQGRWKPQIGARFPLSQAAAAHRLQEDNTLHKQGTLSGKILVIPGS